MNALLIITFLTLDIKIPVPDMWTCQQLAASIFTTEDVEMRCASKEIES